jgi:uncharacterized membrane protein
MDHRTVGRILLLVYVLAVVVSAVFVRVAVAPIAIFGAVVVALWFSYLRPILKARERERARREGSEPPPYWE